MKLKLIDEDWINKSIKAIQEMDKKFLEEYDETDSSKVMGGIISGSENMLSMVKEQLKSVKEEITKAFKAGEMHCATEGKVYPRSISLEEYLKQNNYAE